MRFRKLDMSLKDQRQALVDTFINSIYLYDDKVLITFNYKEGTQTITFEEAAQAASKENGSDLDCFTAPRKTSTHCVLVFLFCLRDGRGSNRAAAHSAASNQPSGLLLSLRVPTRRNVYQGCTHFVPVSFCAREQTSNNTIYYIKESAMNSENSSRFFSYAGSGGRTHTNCFTGT